MGVALYLDEHTPKAITEGLRLRGVDVVTAQEDGAAGTDDPELLDRATELGRALFTFDKDFLREADKRQTEGKSFSGIV